MRYERIHQDFITNYKLLQLSAINAVNGSFMILDAQNRGRERKQPLTEKKKSKDLSISKISMPIRLALVGTARGVMPEVGFVLARHLRGVF